MKKTRLFTTCILLTVTATMLSACNAAENIVDQNTIIENTLTNNTTTENTTEPQNQENTSSPQENNSINSSKSDNEGIAEEQHSTLSYTIGQQLFEKQYERVYSTQQDYSIQLTDQFYLMEEEPGKDVVVYKDNEAIMMRVEVLSQNEWTYDDALEKSISFLTASSKDNSYAPLNLPAIINTKSFIQYDSYVVENESDKVVLLLVKLDEKIIRLTIFDDYITNVSEAFLIQATTIQ